MTTALDKPLTTRDYLRLTKNRRRFQGIAYYVARLWSNAAKSWVTTIGATNFTINVDADPGAGTAIFDWKAQVGEG